MKTPHSIRTRYMIFQTLIVCGRGPDCHIPNHFIRSAYSAWAQRSLEVQRKHIFFGVFFKHNPSNLSYFKIGPQIFIFVLVFLSYFNYPELFLMVSQIGWNNSLTFWPIIPVISLLYHLWTQLLMDKVGDQGQNLPPLSFFILLYSCQNLSKTQAGSYHLLWLIPTRLTPLCKNQPVLVRFRTQSSLQPPKHPLPFC